jgi:hypothetical protein
MYRQALAIVGLCAVTGMAAGQNVPRATLDRPSVTFREPLSSVVGFRPLTNDRIVVADNLEQSVAMIDLASGTTTPIGRHGEGPSEYGMPGPLFPAQGDTTYMLDMGNRRLLVITPDGQIASATIPFPQTAGIPIILPRGADNQGRIYFDLGGIAAPGLQEAAQRGAAPLIRWDRASDKFDTLATVHFPPMQPAGQGQVRISIGGGAYQPRDDWSVLPNGRVGLARATDYHVEWLGGPQPVVGPVVTYDPVKVGTDEKNAWADQMASRGMVVQMVNGQRRTGRPPRPDISKMEWPDVMPPFTGRAVIAAPNGTLWVRRAQAAKATNALYDVFDASGRRVQQVVLTGNREVLGFGPGVVFVSRTDDDDLQWIERFTM